MHILLFPDAATSSDQIRVSEQFVSYPVLHLKAKGRYVAPSICRAMRYLRNDVGKMGAKVRNPTHVKQSQQTLRPQEKSTPTASRLDGCKNANLALHTPCTSRSVRPAAQSVLCHALCHAIHEPPAEAFSLRIIPATGTLQGLKPVQAEEQRASIRLGLSIR